jgi:hypothetical protein
MMRGRGSKRTLLSRSLLTMVLVSPFAFAHPVQAEQQGLRVLSSKAATVKVGPLAREARLSLLFGDELRIFDPVSKKVLLVKGPFEGTVSEYEVIESCGSLPLINRENCIKQLTSSAAPRDRAIGGLRGNDEPR